MNELANKYQLNETELDFRLEDMKADSHDQQIWKEFVRQFGPAPYLWLCKQVNGERVYIPEIDTQLRPARLRA